MTDGTKIIIGILVIGGVWILMSSGIFANGSSNTGSVYDSGSSGCHPSYSGCLKANASDYDCAGGSGNGPYYTGQVRVIGPDVFGLDRDNDGWGCE